ncbi:hypothetical protein BDBG_09269 [Blastomyces gilchristii SLH14081]|uniref:Uncharacterized protein n=1 Tax=Blastomyces gilchristii (strain SLH14081) TaxID=559298 RepID=A0A179V4A8_BLAGS|nr:uncharacterized protein BDBG_09269 [Blastomyces gilchristii SLH14081]OAT14201.1 hypothetical protein BDBG_09269 [Blastomyces gilchristii SLH14081]
MQATNKRKAADEEEGQQQEHGHQRPRKWPERSSRASDINYDVREYYRGIQLDEKIYSTSSQKKDMPRKSGPDGTSHIDAQLAAATCTPPAQRAVMPTLTWEPCFECIQELCRNPREMKCRPGPCNSKCRHCDATYKACLKPSGLGPRLAKIQTIASSIITTPSALGWPDEVSRREKRLSEEFTIFQEEMETYIAGADMAISPRASHYVSGVSGSKVTVGALVSATDPTPTAIGGGAGSVKTPDKPLVMATLSSPFRAVKTESPPGSSPYFKMSPTAKMLIMPPNMTDKATVTSSPPLFAHFTTKGDGSNGDGDGDGDDLKLPTPTPSPLELGQDPAPAAQMESKLRTATAEANTVAPSIKVATEENATGGDIQAASTDLNATSFNLGAKLLTVLGSIESNLARIADTLEVKNRRGNGSDGDCGIGGEMVANRAYWE